jgi:hypothetical protein
MALGTNYARTSSGTGRGGCQIGKVSLRHCDRKAVATRKTSADISIRLCAVCDKKYGNIIGKSYEKVQPKGFLTLMDGRMVPEFEKNYHLPIHTCRPHKWAMVDMEDGNIWVLDPDKPPDQYPPMAATAKDRKLLRRILGVKPESDRSLFIWWVDQAACEKIAAEGLLKENVPQYLRDQFNGRFGRPGRGRLWSDGQFGDAQVCPWPKTALAEELSKDSGGIVIWAKDHSFVASLPGIVTDLELNRQ